GSLVGSGVSFKWGSDDILSLDIALCTLRSLRTCPLRGHSILILKLYHTSHQTARALQALPRIGASCRKRVFSPMIVGKPGQRHDHP
ncbi:MAG TPA: hypothetical protein VH593_04445, partial [Ktedonobacteraceae bacterium]